VAYDDNDVAPVETETPELETPELETPEPETTPEGGVVYTRTMRDGTSSGDVGP